MVYQPLVKYYAALKKYIRQGTGLYMTDWASMDNSPRIPTIVGGGTAVDTSAEMTLFAEQLGEIASLLGKPEEAESHRRDAKELARLINEKMWDPERKFYYDLTVDGKRGDAKTIAAYWTLLAGVASNEQADALAAHLKNPKTFGRKHRVPTCSADVKEFRPAGGYWRGAVWAPTNTMVIRGLERYGKHDLAKEIALEHLDRVAQVFEKTGTVWENYAPDSVAQGKPAKPDFVGWTGIAPILYFLEYQIGLRPDALNNRLNWMLSSNRRCGCERFRFNGHVATLIATPDKDRPSKVTVTVDSDGPFDLHVERGGETWDLRVEKGENTFKLDTGLSNGKCVERGSNVD
jgi:glycogen debranching enzyme